MEKRKYRSGYHWEVRGNVVAAQKHENQPQKTVVLQSATLPKQGDSAERKMPQPKVLNSSININSDENILTRSMKRGENKGLSEKKSNTTQQKQIHQPIAKEAKQNIALTSLLLAGLLGLGATAFIGKKKKAQRISQWAAKNKWKTRMLIPVLHMGIAGLAYATGLTLKDMDVNMSEHTNAALLSTGALALAAYSFKKSYLYRKMVDMLLIVTGFGLVMTFANQHTTNIINSQQTEISTSSEHASDKKEKDISEENLATKIGC
ncbi:MAG: hypothetical protein ACKOXB_11355 [Flavobacteriales bacterium]